VICLHLSPRGVLATRFALSPLWESVLSYRASRCPDARALRGSWLEAAQSAGRSEGTEALDASLGLLEGAGRHVCDFVLPPPGPCFDDELAQVRAADPATVVADLRVVYGEQPAPAVQRFIEAPEAGIAAAADAIARYWTAVLLPRWPRVRAVLESDIAYRGHAMAVRGAGALFDDLDPSVRWHDGTLSVDRPHDLAIDVDDRGIVLLPLVFGWPRLIVAPEGACAPMIAYSPRGAESFWLGERPERDDALAGLVGPARDVLLRVLARPRTTTELAQGLGVTPSAVSQRLADLRRLGLVEPQRLGRRVYYRRSARAERLLELFAHADATPVAASM
jgi:DNA-binding transcriptional ArsR family regulator